MLNRTVGVMLVVFGLVIGGCSTTAPPLTDSTAVVADGTLAPIAPSRVGGQITITGSSTVYPLTLRMVREFRQAGSRADITVGFTGTGAGFRAFCGGAAVDIINASRPINAEELSACQAIQREPIGFQIGTDALAVVVSAENTFARSLSMNQLQQIFTGAATNWSQVDASFPNEPINVFSPGADSGTFDFFVDHVLDGDDAALLATPRARFSEDDEVLQKGVIADPYAIGFFGYAYFKSNLGKLRALAIDTGNGAVEPNQASAINGNYALARPLFIYTSTQALNSKPEVAAFVSYYVQFVDLQIDDVGYFPATAATKAAMTEALVAAIQ